MSHVTQEQGPPNSAEVIREVCQRTEAGAIWEALEAKGIETTPGVIHQAIAHPVSPDQPPQPEHTHGLAAEDLATLGTLAVKAGGVEKLMHILSVCQETQR